jgi:CubicO group peptidase (beta-lactamase class C family)
VRLEELPGLAGLLPEPGATDPGYHLAVLRGHEVAFQETRGLANVDAAEPLTAGSIFYVGSLAKQFVAACVALLERDGALDPDDAVSRYVPGLPAWSERVTVRHLVHHTGGLPPPPYGPDGLSPAGVRAMGNADRMRRVAALTELPAEPGSAYVYSNDGYLLLAEVVAAASGTSLRAFAHERLVAPLDMRDTFFRDAPEPLPAAAARGHFRAGDGERYVEPARFHAVGAGGLWTTAADLARWNANLDDDALTEGWLPERLTTRGRLNDRTEIHYAWGVSVRTHRGLGIVSHGGSFPGWSAKMIRFPDRRTTVIVLANDEELDASELAFRVADHVLADALDHRAPSAADTLRGSDG